MAKTCTPAQLLAKAECFDCGLTRKELLAVRTYLLCQNLTATQGGGGFTPCCIPNPAQNLHIITFSDTTIQIGWSLIGACGPDRFTVFWGTSPGVYTNSASQVGGFLSGFTITGLAPMTTYFIAVQMAQGRCLAALSAEISQSTSNCSLALVNTWKANVIANGGTVSGATVGAVCTFAHGLVTDGLDPLMIYVLPLVPDGLIAATTPLYNTAGGSNPAVNNGPFVAGDLTVNGLVGDALTKWLNIGVNISTAFPSAQNAGWSTYAFSTNATGTDSLAYISGTNIGIFTAAKFTDNNAYSSIGVATVGQNTVQVASPGAGFYTGNRTSNTVHKLYYAKSTSPFAQLGATDALAFNGVFPNSPNSLVFAVNNIGGIGTQFQSSDRLSFYAIHQGLTAAQAQNLFNRVQTLRTTLGGGFV